MYFTPAKNILQTFIVLNEQKGIIMSNKNVVFCSADNVNPKVKVDETSTEVSYVAETRILFNPQKHVVIIGNTAIEYHDEHEMINQIVNYLNNYPITLRHTIFNVRTATADDMDGAVKFQKLLQERIPLVTLKDLYHIKRLEDFYLMEFHDCMIWHRGITDADKMTEAVLAETGYPEWFDLFDSVDGVIETVTMFAKRFIEEKLWITG